MSWNNKVMWTEGMFLQPHHFQQHDRYIEHLLAAGSDLATPYPWGVRQLVLDQDLLAMGKLALLEATGILPDGTPFDIPANDPPPLPLDLDETAVEQILYLALPVRQQGMPEAGAQDDEETMLRYRTGEIDVRDNNLGPQTETLVQVGRLDLRLLLEQENRNGFAHMGLARVLECGADKRIVLDDAYIPPCLDYQASPLLARFIGELLGWLHQRGDDLAVLVSASGRGSVAEWADFLLLQLVNRLEPVTVHLKETHGLHPEVLYRWLLMLAGELATFVTKEKRPPQLPLYRHDDLAATFNPLINLVRDYLSRRPPERAISIPIQERKYGFRVALLTDPSLLSQASFVLAAHANVSPDALRRQFPDQFKVGPIEKIQEFQKLALPGIALHPLHVAPRQIPFHAGFAYFELDRSSEFWRQLDKSGGFGMHVSGDFPDLQLELWAIRE